jgi:enoyl-CoA hydratase/carnithine racemase
MEVSVSELTYEQDGQVVTLTLNRPEARNPVSDLSMVDAICEALDRINGDTSVRAAVLTGAGSAFSAGGNLKKMAEPGGLLDARPVANRWVYKSGIQRLPLAFEQLEVPVIAAVNGPAMGAGCDLACMCDIRIAASSAKFAESFVKLGLVSGDGGAWLLPRTIGASAACELLFTGDTIDATEALRIGLVSRVVPDADLLAQARALALRIASNPPHAVRLTKRLMREGRGMSLSASLEMAASMQALAHATGDHREAMRAVLAKEQPKFTGD